MDDILEGYAASAAELVERFEALSPEEIYAPVIDLLPPVPVRVADIGAGTGRDAAWLAAKGHRVLAVEPVRELREAGRALHRSPAIEWMDDRLPRLEKVRRAGQFDLVILSGVWQHLDDAARELAMDSIGQVTGAGGMLVMSLRHGPGPANRRVFQVSPEETLRAASRSGLVVARRAETGSIQAGNRALGVSWTWLVLTKPA